LAPRGGEPPLEDLAFGRLPPHASAEAIVGEHLRVFVNECTWRWARERGVDYSTAVVDRGDEASAGFLEFVRMCNAATFEAALIARGVVSDSSALGHWEVQLEDGLWSPFAAEHGEALERTHQSGGRECALRIRNWSYQVDLVHMVQRNMATWRERAVRRVPRLCGDDAIEGRVTKADLELAINHFVRLQTLPQALVDCRCAGDARGDVADPSGHWPALEHSSSESTCPVVQHAAPVGGAVSCAGVDGPDLDARLAATSSASRGGSSGSLDESRPQPPKEDGPNSCPTKTCPQEKFLRDAAALAAAHAGLGMPPDIAVGECDTLRRENAMRANSFEAEQPLQPTEPPAGVRAEGDASPLLGIAED